MAFVSKPVTGAAAPGYTWPGGSNFSDVRSLVRGGSAGDMAVRYSPGAGNEFIVMGGNIYNQDTVNRECIAAIKDSLGNELVRIAQAGAIGAAGWLSYPSMAASSGGVNIGFPLVVAGTDMLEARIASVAATEDARFLAYLRYLGSAPTITTVNA